MKDYSLLQSFSPISLSQIRDYLTFNEWVEDGKINNMASVWHRPEQNNIDYEILLPEVQNIKDYYQRVRDLIQVLSKFENRAVDDVLRDISNYSADHIKIRVIHDDVKNGSIPLEDGVLLIDKARELLSCATLSTLSKKKYFSGNRPQEVSAFMSKARLGQTEIGSYVINIFTPLDLQESQQTDLADKRSFSRFVTRNLANSLDAINSTIYIFKDSENLNIFDDAVKNGVSANLCDALIGLAGEKHNRDVKIEISFSCLEKQEDDIKVNHFFKSEIIPYLEKASEYLKDNYVIQSATVTGFVKKLDREKDNEFGLVTIIAEVGGREKNVTFELLQEDYLEAIHAHENKHIVECSGDLYISARSAKLLNSSGFRVIKNGELFE